MVKDEQENDAKELSVVPAGDVLPSEAQADEPGAREIYRETQETTTTRRVREVVRFEPVDSSIPIEKLSDPVIAQVLLDERTHWMSEATELSESNRELTYQIRKRETLLAALNIELAIVKTKLKFGKRVTWLESLLFVVGGGLLVSPLGDAHWCFGMIGGLLVAVATASSLLRSRDNKNGAGI